MDGGPRAAVTAALLTLALAGCYGMRPSSGGGQTEFTPPRTLRAGDVVVPAGFRIDVVASGLTFPTGVAFDAEGRPHVVESGYSYGEVWTTPRLLRIEDGGRMVEIARGGRNGPWNGVASGDGAFYVAEGGVLEGGRILRITRDGRQQVLVSGLPSVGDHHTDGPALGPDGHVYFGQGTATNSGVVGPDNADFGWYARHPAFHDIPCADVELAGHNFDTVDLRHPQRQGQATTGAYLPFGSASRAGQVIRGQVPCSGAVLRVARSGGRPQLVAWGFRNPFGLAFAPDGRLYVTDNAYDDRGSRPVWGTPDLLWVVQPGLWHGWPDYSGDLPLSDPQFRPPGKVALKPVLAKVPNTPPRPVARLGVHSSSNGLDFSRNADFGYVGEAFIAQFGDQAPTTGKVLAPVGFKVVQVDPRSGVIRDFAVNRGSYNAPASVLRSGGLERPVALRFSPDGRALYVVDFGVLLMRARGPQPQPGTGVLWRITRSGQP